jgi:hypothetical protein
VKIKLSVILGPFLLWACSADPRSQGVGALGSENQQAAHSTREKEQEAKVDQNHASNAIDGGSASHGTDTSAGPELSSDGKEPERKTDAPSTAGNGSQASEDKEENGVTPPHKITGAFLVGEVIEDESDESLPLRIGIVAKNNDERMALEPDRFALNWVLTADEALSKSLRLLPTKNPDYDRVLEFDGSLDELESFENSFAINLSISEDAGPARLESVVKSRLKDLLSPTPDGQ